LAVYGRLLALVVILAVIPQATIAPNQTTLTECLPELSCPEPTAT
jgi:hypothetical protein